ncbi:uncharacterized protein ACHE_20662S [Aspergillus chevalieri]|uniref:DUF202 domain-containing protein n=1 Tax=Aspergillus chevalieri TaxID=182096 RepID=A0A7R7ZL34_ASPCH|nr:uncharacterized protein ACHE_20662S [Aspergillus chevalieri]BCR85204.1 hypothetical protein ACHE_20662S [Aspergillus chevalieri]
MISRIRHWFLPRPVPNNGSQLRDHLANERTFLSWTRMGLAFAAMALALGRLGIIDHVFNTEWKRREAAKSKEQQTTGPEPKIPLTGANDILAGKLCWVISAWSFGYGIFRYVSIRQTLLSGRFVPAIWGPVLMTCGSVGSLGVLLQSGTGLALSESSGSEHAD